MVFLKSRATSKPIGGQWFFLARCCHSITLMWAIWQLIFFPIDQSFPYPVVLPVLTVSLILLIPFQWKLVRSITKGLRGVALFAILALSIIGCCGMSFWAKQQVSTVSYSSRSLSVPSDEFLLATVAMEDGNFYRHNGIDWIAIHRALRVDVQQWRIKQGGSTITQQLAKNLFLSDERTGFRKFRELFLTFALESRFSKPEILLLYTHSISYGMHQHGIDAAAKYYYKKSPHALSLAESATLVGIVPHNSQEWPSCDSMEKWRATALSRINYWFPSSFTEHELIAAGRTSLGDLFINTNGPCTRGAVKSEER